MQSNQIQAVLFDLDGTLLDSLTDIAGAVNAILTANGYPLRTQDEVRSFVGRGARALLFDALPDFAKPRTDELMPAFRLHYDKHKTHTHAFSGAAECLLKLRAAGIKTAVVSNKYDEAVQNIARSQFPSVAFAIGGSDRFPHKPAPDMVLAALKALDVPPQNAVYVGDMDVDILTAQNAGLSAVLVDWGFQSREQLLAAGATRIVADFEELLRLVLPD